MLASSFMRKVSCRGPTKCKKRNQEGEEQHSILPRTKIRWPWNSLTFSKNYKREGGRQHNIPLFSAFFREREFMNRCLSIPGTRVFFSSGQVVDVFCGRMELRNTARPIISCAFFPLPLYAILLRLCWKEPPFSKDFSFVYVVYSSRRHTKSH